MIIYIYMYTVRMYIYIYIYHIYYLILIIITITSHYIIMIKPSNGQGSPPEVYRGKATDVRQLPSEAGFSFGDVCGGGNKI